VKFEDFKINTLYFIKNKKYSNTFFFVREKNNNYIVVMMFFTNIIGDSHINLKKKITKESIDERNFVWNRASESNRYHEFIINIFSTGT